MTRTFSDKPAVCAAENSALSVAELKQTCKVVFKFGQVERLTGEVCFRWQLSTEDRDLRQRSLHEPSHAGAGQTVVSFWADPLVSGCTKVRGEA